MSDLPNGWSRRPLSELLRVTRGASPRPINDWIAPHGTPWVKIADATASQSRVISVTREFIRDEGRSRSVVVQPGDLIVSNSATPGIPRFMGIEACIHDGWLLLRELRNLDPLFLYYTIENDRPLIVGQGNGSIFTNLKTEILKRHVIALPPLREQQAIAEVLGALDDKIAANTALTRTADSYGSSLVRDALSGDRVPLAAIARITMGSSPRGETLNDAADGMPFFQGTRDFGFRTPTRRVYTTAPVRTAAAGDILVSVRAPVGEVNLAGEDLCIGRGIAAVRSNGGTQATLFYQLKTEREAWAPYEAEGTVFGSINRDQLHGILVHTVDESGRASLEHSLAAIGDSIASLERENRTLAATRDALLPQLMSGKLRVRDAEKIAAEAGA